MRHLTSENNLQKARVRELENELRHQKVLFEFEKARVMESENQMLKKSSRDSGFESVENSDDAFERAKASHAKERMSTIPLLVDSNNRTGEPNRRIKIKSVSSRSATRNRKDANKDFTRGERCRSRNTGYRYSRGGGTKLGEQCT